MITAQNNLIGQISAKQNITGKLNNAVIKEYPELEDLTVIPSTKQQTFKSEKYGYDNVTVEAVEGEELSIVPSATEQIKEGIFNKVTVAGNSNLVPENIKEGEEIFGVQGSAKTTNAKITNGYYLFYKGVRVDYINEILSLCDGLTTCSYMFYQCSGVTELDLSNLNVGNVTDMSYMFATSTSLTSLNLSNFNTQNVTTMVAMFNGCTGLTSLDLSSFNTQNVTTMNSIFYNCTKLTSLDLSSFNTSNVTNMDSMFSGCINLISLDLSNFNTSNVTSMVSMFNNCSNLTSLDLSNFDASKVKNNSSMFFSCKNLTNLKFMKNLGKGYTQKTNNYNSYKLDLSYSTLLTHESLMSIINNLYDLNLTYNVAGGGTLYTQTLNLGSTNKAKLTAEEIAIATNKGWNVT